jgi:hypothetical protein
MQRLVFSSREEVNLAHERIFSLVLHYSYKGDVGGLPPSVLCSNSFILTIAPFAFLFGFLPN